MRIIHLSPTCTQTILFEIPVESIFQKKKNSHDRQRFFLIGLLKIYLIHNNDGNRILKTLGYQRPIFNSG